MKKEDEAALVQRALTDAALPSTDETSTEPFAGLAIGISTNDLDLPPNTTHISPEQFQIMRAYERTRTVRATESLDEAVELILAAQERTAIAAERQADALETLTALLASCIGQTYAWCPDSKVNETPKINFLRASPDGAPFKCGGEDRDNDTE